MQLELASLMSNVGQAVQQAQAQLERQAMESFCGYFSPTPETPGDADASPALSPISRRFSLPDAANGTRQVEAPLLSLVPVPAFTMEEATVRFTMEIRDQSVDKNSVTTQTDVKAGSAHFTFYITAESIWANWIRVSSPENSVKFT